MWVQMTLGDAVTCVGFAMLLWPLSWRMKPRKVLAWFLPESDSYHSPHPWLLAGQGYLMTTPDSKRG